MGINWSGADITFMLDYAGFMEMILVDRMPDFMPEPPVIDQEDFLIEEFPFEVYIYFLAFRYTGRGFFHFFITCT